MVYLGLCDTAVVIDAGSSGASRVAFVLLALASACGDNLPPPDARDPRGTIVACEQRADPACEVGEIGCPCDAVTGGTTTGCALGVCVDGVCRATCELRAGVPTCDRATTCVSREDAIAEPMGVCEPTCDPLTQCALMSARPDACGASDTRAPDRGCVGVPELTCRAVPASALAATDREAPVSGVPIDRACAPGYVALLEEATGSTRRICAGLCAVLETDATPMHAGNAKGDASAAGKLVGERAPRVGDATCDVGAKGAEPSSMCRFVWPLLGDEVPASFVLHHLDTLGVCIAIAHYAYDADGDGTAETAMPDCATLPPRSAATPGTFDDAADWGCQKRANGAAPALRDWRVERSARSSAQDPR